MSLRLLVFATAGITLSHAAVIGTNPPALPLTDARIAQLAPEQRPAWREYLHRSVQLRRADQQSLVRDLKAAGLQQPLPLRESHGAGRRMVGRAAAWYGSAEARRMADNVVTFQTPAGGWSKNFDPTDHPRRAGEAYAPNNNSRFLSATDNDRPADLQWNYVGTIDNDATTTELWFLARVAVAADANAGAAWRASFRRGLDYLSTAQYPNGGWPQVYPLDGGYHDEITFNDDAMTNVLAMLRDVAAGEAPFSWLSADERRHAARVMDRGVQCILACQIRVGGQLTGWCQQNDELTLVPASARNYEMPSLASGETAGIITFLMSLEHPSHDVVVAIHAAARWLRATALTNVRWGPAPDASGRALRPSPGHPPVWARYAEIGTNRPLFGDRDKSIHDRVDEISSERRNGYAWYGEGPNRALETYDRWSHTHPE